jgi:hypothetical protein
MAVVKTTAGGQAAARLLADGAANVGPHPAYLTPLEAPDRTVQLVRVFWYESRGVV